MSITSKDLVGSWILEKFTIEDREGSSRPWRDGANGILIYSADGHMSVSINSPKQESWLDSLLFYAGRYRVENDGRIVHEVLNATEPKRIGSQMPRRGILEGKTLTLIGEGDYGKATVIWRRL